MTDYPLALPTLGRIVIYVGTDGSKYAALVTAVHADPATNYAPTAVSLATFGPQSLYFQPGPVSWSPDANTKNTWTWPPRVG